MAFIPDAYDKTHIEQVSFRDSVSEGLLKQWGAAVNKAINEGVVVPVGTITKSVLTTAQFQQEQGPGWILADGATTYEDSEGATLPISASEYGILTASTAVPDLRGVLTRMKDHGAGAFTDLALGTYSADQLKSHTHTYTWDTTNMIVTDNFALFNDDSNTKKTPLPDAVLSYTIGNTGGNESRARNITVNFFIKIN